MRILPYLLPTLMIAGACGQNGQSLSEGEALMIRDSVTALLNRYHNAIRKDGLVAEFRYLDSSEAFYWKPPGYLETIGYDSVSRMIRRNAQAIASVDNRWEMLNVQPLAPDRASYSGRIRSVTVDTGGKRVETFLVESGLVVRQPDGWKLQSGQTEVLNRD